MIKRPDIRIHAALLTAMVLLIAQPSYAGHGGGGHGGGHGGYGHGGYGHGGGYGHAVYYGGGGGGYGYPVYYAPAYNDYGYREYAPYPRYGVAAAAGAFVGGLLAPRYGHRYDY